MPCKEIHSWTFSELVGAFLDLGITYFLLCASTLAYFASKFLGLFGLCLPCPCNNGLFGDPNNNTCWQRVLVDCPSENISSVQYSVMSRFPFDSMWDGDQNSESSIGLMNEKNHGNGSDGLEDEVSCGLNQERGEFGIGRSAMHVWDGEKARSDTKEKEISIQKARQGLRRRRKGPAANGKFSSVSLYDALQSNARAFSQSPASVSKMANESIDVSSGASLLSGDPRQCGRDSPLDNDLLGRVSYGFEPNELVDKDILTEKDASCLNDLNFEAPIDLLSDGNEKNTIRALEQALEKEHSTCATLYMELEKERNAAATAADEAMAMILRLQEEKASIEMEARQYQRMIEEKSAYDFEEMNILKEILLRREREKHFLEKEFEVYRQLIFANEHLESDVQEIGTIDEKIAAFLKMFSENPMLMQQNVGESIGEKEKVETPNKYLDYKGRGAMESQNHTLAFGKGLSIPELNEVDTLRYRCLHQHFPGGNEMNKEIEKMELISPVMSPIDREKELQNLEGYPPCNSSTYNRCNLSDNTIGPTGEVHSQSNIGSGQGLASNITESCGETSVFVPHGCCGSKKHESDSCVSMLDVNPCVQDVTVIEDKYDISTEMSENEKLSNSYSLDVLRKCDSPITSRLSTDQNINRRSSDITSGLPPMGCLKTRPFLSDFRRNSMSAVDFERFKIENEVGWLQERLRIIQEGRGKLNTSIGNWEKEKIQFQLSENIVGQLREMTEPGKAVHHQASLPLPSWKKDMSTKRSWRSVSLGVHRSS